MKAGELIRGKVVIGHAAPGTEVFSVGAGVDGTDRCDKSQAVSRGDLATSPSLGQRQGGLVVHQPRVRGDQGIGADIVLQHPAQPVAGQRGVIRPHQGLQSDIAGLGDQCGTDANRQIGRPGIGFADMGERLGKTRPGVDLEQHLGQVNPRQACHDLLTELDKVRRLDELLEIREDQLLLARAPLDAYRGIARQIGRGLPIRRIQLLAQPFERLLGGFLVAERAAHLRAQCLPLRTAQELQARIAPAVAATDKNIPSLQAVLESRQRVPAAGLAAAVRSRLLTPVCRWPSGCTTTTVWISRKFAERSTSRARLSTATWRYRRSIEITGSRANLVRLQEQPLTGPLAVAQSLQWSAVLTSALAMPAGVQLLRNHAVNDK